MARVAHLDHLRQSPRTLVEQQLRDEEGAAVGVDVGFVEGGERGVGVGDVGLFVFVSLLRVWMEKCVEDRSWPGLGLGFHPYPKTREEEQDQLTAVLITKSQAKYWPFFFAAGVLKVWALFSAIAGSSSVAGARSR